MYVYQLLLGNCFDKTRKHRLNTRLSVNVNNSKSKLKRTFVYIAGVYNTQLLKINKLWPIFKASLETSMYSTCSDEALEQ